MKIGIRLELQIFTFWIQDSLAKPVDVEMQKKLSERIRTAASSTTCCR